MQAKLAIRKGKPRARNPTTHPNRPSCRVYCPSSYVRSSTSWVRTIAGIRSLSAFCFGCHRPAFLGLSRATSLSCHQAVLSVPYRTYMHTSIVVIMSSEQELQINPVVGDSIVHNNKVRQPEFLSQPRMRVSYNPPN